LDGLWSLTRIPIALRRHAERSVIGASGRLLLLGILCLIGYWLSFVDRWVDIGRSIAYLV